MEGNGIMVGKRYAGAAGMQAICYFLSRVVVTWVVTLKQFIKLYVYVLCTS